MDIVLTNPPFGGREEDGIESNFPKHFQTRETADLFLALIIRLLKPGGRAAVVLPDGTLFGEGVKTRLKEHPVEECNLHTIVRLPNSGRTAPRIGMDPLPATHAGGKARRPRVLLERGRRSELKYPKRRSGKMALRQFCNSLLQEIASKKKLPQPVAKNRFDGTAQSDSGGGLAAISVRNRQNAWQ